VTVPATTARPASTSLELCTVARLTVVACEVDTRPLVGRRNLRYPCLYEIRPTPKIARHFRTGHLLRPFEHSRVHFNCYDDLSSYSFIVQWDIEIFRQIRESPVWGIVDFVLSLLVSLTYMYGCDVMITVAVSEVVNVQGC
jgi:hypothetical protein